MIRVNYVLKRAPGMSREEFEDYFRNVYGPLVAKHQSRLDLRRYVQSYTLLKDPTGEALRAARPEMHEPVLVFSPYSTAPPSSTRDRR